MIRGDGGDEGYAAFHGALTLVDHQTYRSRSLNKSLNPDHLDRRTVKNNFDLNSAELVKDIVPKEALELLNQGKITKDQYITLI